MNMAEKKSRHLGHELAIALSYEAQAMDAPIVSASGSHEMARLIRNVARRFGIPVASDEDLASALAELAWEEEIPMELYQRVASLLNSAKAKRQ